MSRGQLCLLHCSNYKNLNLISLCFCLLILKNDVGILEESDVSKQFALSFKVGLYPSQLIIISCISLLGPRIG